MTDITPTAFREKTLRIDAIIPLAYAVVVGAAYDLLRDFIDEDLLDAKEVLATSKMFKAVADEMGTEGDVELAIEWIEDQQDSGFLIHASRPVMKYWPNGAASMSWGHYNTAWLYGATMDEALLAASEWADKLDTEQRAKAA